MQLSGGPALGWAKRKKLIEREVRVEIDRKGSGMRSRPVTAEEFDRMIAAVPKVRKIDPEKWDIFLRGLWWSGLRIGEALKLSWDPDAEICVKLGGKYPVLRFYAEAHKGRRDQLLPIAPEFGELLLSIPKESRHGLVFRLYGPDGVSHLSVKRATRIVSRVGQAAGVVTNSSDGQTATAHDLRRAFGTRWATRVMPATLQVMMRHKSIETTMKYYVGHQADEISEIVWAAGQKLQCGYNSPCATPDSDSAAPLGVDASRYGDGA
jgi:integrase